MKNLILFILIFPFIGMSQNTGLHLDGTGDYITTGFNGISGGSSRSVQCWFKGTYSSDQRFFLDMGLLGVSYNGGRFSFKINPGASVARIEIGGGGLDGSTNIRDNVWHQLTVTYDSSATTNQYKIYVDGSLDVQGNITAGTLNTPATSASPMTIGIRTNLTATTAVAGEMDEVRVWNKALTPAEITANYNKELCGTPSGLVAYYKMNEGTAAGTNTSITSLIDEVTPSSINTLSGFSLIGATSNYTTHSLAAAGSSSSATVNVCNSYLSPTGKTYTTTGWYNDTIAIPGGCDSLITTNVIIRGLSLGSISANLGVLTAPTSGNNYQWLDCNNGNAVTLVADTNRTFVPVTNGNYACIVTNSFGCSDTTTCFAVNNVGVSEHNLNSAWKVYPNPSQGFVTITTQESNGIVKIYNNTGKLIKGISLNNTTHVLDLSDLDNGVYQIVFSTNDNNSTKSLILNR